MLTLVTRSYLVWFSLSHIHALIVHVCDCLMEELWLKHKVDIHRYYIVQDQTLKYTIEAMSSYHGFHATLIPLAYMVDILTDSS